MIYTKPYFFDEFRCKADKCTDTCCAGWEVDIDNESYAKYKTVSGEFSKRLLDGIDASGEVPCFKLCGDERCVFLNKSGLCDIYSELGEDYLCEICREHPRFYDFFDGVTEMGLGLCCEKVCEMIFESDKPVTFESFCVDDDDFIDEEDNLYFMIREKCFEIIYNREETLYNRIGTLLDYAVAVQNEIFADEYAVRSCDDVTSLFDAVIDIFAETEPINDEWQVFISDMQKNRGRISAAKDSFLFNEHEYEQVLIYITYRHFMQSRFTGNILPSVCFAVVSLIFIYLADCKIFADNNMYTNEDRIFSVKLWSKQIEYSEENTQFVAEKAFDLLVD